MKNTHGSSYNLVTDEVLGALMLHQICREINITYIVTVDQGGTTNRRMKLAQKLA
jgi:hypothetical protein